DRNRSHWSTSKTPSYTKSVSWQHHLDAPNLGRLIQDVWNNPGFVSPGASKQYHPGCGAGSSFTGLRRHT
ncbi:hypothetical protein MZE72_22185, partial [Escherichia coli]|nr:hypothetical protein [Escherichia coli]